VVIGDDHGVVAEQLRRLHLVGEEAGALGLAGVADRPALLRLAWLRRQGPPLAVWYGFLVIGTLTLLTTYHLYYDALLLLPLLAFGRRLARPGQLALLACLLPLLLPLNGVAQALGNPAGLHFVYFLMPLALLGVLLLLLARPVRSA